MKLAVIGSRGFNDYALLSAILTEYYLECGTDLVIISGGARGADSLAERWADEHDLKKSIYLADWDTHGKSAGHVRNRVMAKECDEAVAFWDGVSKGSKGMIATVKKLNKTIVVVGYT